METFFYYPMAVLQIKDSKRIYFGIKGLELVAI